MLSNAWRLAAIAATASVSMSALADGKSDYNESVRDYFRCATTPAVEFPGTIVDAALATPALSTLTSAVVAANLAGTLSGPGPFTVYAPTNAAFAKVPASVLSAITSDVKLLTAVLTYHVTPGTGRQTDPRAVFGQPKEAGTVQGQTVFYNRGKGPQVNQSNVACQPVRTRNGTVYIIDSVLLPQF